MDIMLGLEDIDFTILELYEVSSLPYLVNNKGHIKGNTPLLMSWNQGIWSYHNDFDNVFI